MTALANSLLSRFIPGRARAADRLEKARPVQPPRALSLPAGNLYLLFAGLVLAAAPHVERLPWWVNAWIVVLMAWRVLLVARDGRARVWQSYR